MHKRAGERVSVRGAVRADAQAMVPFCGGGRYQDGGLRGGAPPEVG